jgi:Putative esterase
VSIGGEFRTAKRFTTKAASALRAPALLALILLILSSAQAASATSPSDDFNRANGSLGANWTAISDGALTISSQAVVGASATAGAIRTAETYTSDQSSQIQTTSTQLSGGQWVGPSVRTQNNGQTTYLGLYFWNSGSPQLRLYKRSAGTWIQLGSSYNSGALAAGTTLQLTATGSTISFLQNGVSRITVSDTSITGGAPGIMTYGQGTADNWVGGGAGGSTPTYAVGGSVSGLSGTVVLQDNGGDNLSVSANGPFSFATKLAGGAAYNVTVKTNPSGQTCSVTNGSGTIGSADVTNVAVSCSTAPPPTGGTDDFNRADGSLGSNWSSVNDGALTISAQAVLGTSATAGAIRTAETYTSDQSSQIQLTSTQLSGSQWVGPTVRTQSGGQTTYLGIYYWNSGSPQLQLYKRIAGAWTQLGSSYNSGALPAGTTLQLSASGSTISLLQNGVARITATDGSISGGAPGIMTYGQATADNWVGSGTTPGPGNSGFNATYRSTDANGVDYYDVTSNDNGTGIQTLRVLAPTNPAAGVPHNFLYLLPVEAGLGTVFGDGIATLEALDAQNQYNLTIVEPSFATEPWYADNPNDASLHYDTFMTKDLVPWATQNLATSGHEQNWLIGFSKSGIGGQGLLLNHPDVFTLAASWDFPADMSTYGQFIGSADQYGTDANFQANYRLTPLFLEAHKLPLTTSNRIWIGSYQTFQTDVSDYDALLNSEGIPHTTEAPMYMAHRWDSGWVQIALAALHQDSQNLLTSP